LLRVSPRALLPGFVLSLATRAWAETLTSALKAGTALFPNDQVPLELRNV